MTSSNNREIILFHYDFSPFSKRVIWYLNLRKIPYSECIQPPILPRPTLTTLGISYRRIPILSIGRDIYTDSRLIIQKLNILFPPTIIHPSISATTPEQVAIERLLEYWIIDGGVFSRCVGLIPIDHGMLRDKAFLEDRRQMIGGGGFSLEGLERGRGEGLVEMRGWFEGLEGVLGGGREWVLGGEGPMRADIEASWPFIWLRSLPNSLPPNLISSTQFPKTFAYLDRFENYINALPSQKMKTLSGAEVIAKFENSTYGYAEGDLGIEEMDPAGFKKGELLEVWPIDSGFNNRDTGRLVGLSWDEVVIEGRMTGGGEVRIHCPRHGFRIARVEGEGAKL